MPARSSASRSWTGPASTPSGWPSIISPPSASAPRCTCWACSRRRAPSGCASARRCRWRALYHPLRLAEEVALLDVLSGGRVNWGAGRGFAHSRVQRLRRAARGMRRALSRGRRDRAARRWTRSASAITASTSRSTTSRCCPSPCSSRIRRSGWRRRSEGAIDWAASRGFSILMDPHASFKELAGKRQRYATRTGRGRLLRPGPRHPDGAPDGAGADSASEAEAIARRGAQWIVDSYSGPQHSHRKAMPPRNYDGKEPAQHYVDSVILHGTPEAMVDKVAELKEDGRPQLPDVRAAQPRQLPPARRQGRAQAHRMRAHLMRALPGR